jgi:imidazolonepropionase
MKNTVLLHSIRGLWLPPRSLNGPVKGKSLRLSNLQENAWLLVKDGLIDSFGSMEALPDSGGLPDFDCSGRYVLPSFCDAHSHLVFAAWRENEMEMRLSGMSYLEIAAQGGGILNSAGKLEECPEEKLYEDAFQRLAELVAMGTGALEIKSGYGLSTAAELKMLRVIARLRESAPIPVKATFLGAHAIPKKYENRREYIELVCREMIPAIAAEGLADYCDVFCDTGFFTEAETVEILETGLRYGLKPKVHANELARSGGVQAAVRCAAVSADHLECLGEEEIALLAGSSVIPVLLPGTAYFLNIHPPDARRLIEAGLPVALASDYNPGTCPSGNMELVLSMAASMLKMHVNESLNAATINGAYAMDLQQSAGQIAAGRTANLLVTKEIPSLSFLPYHFGQSSLDKVLVQGQIMQAGNR